MHPRHIRLSFRGRVSAKTKRIGTRKVARIALLFTILVVSIVSIGLGSQYLGQTTLVTSGSIIYGPPPNVVYDGFSNYPYPLTTAAVQDVIDLMIQHNLNVYRISCRPSWDEGSHPYRPELIRYFLDHAPDNMIIIVDANHIVWSQTGEMTQQALDRWDSHIKPRLRQVIEDFPNEPRVFVELFNELMVGFDEYYVRAQDLIDYIEGLNLEYYPVLVVNKLYTSGLNWKTLSYLKNDIYQGYHGYFNDETVQGLTNSMQNAVNMGIKIINTEMGPDSRGTDYFDQAKVDALQQFYDNCAQINVGNCFWISWGTEWYEDYLRYGMEFTP